MRTITAGKEWFQWLSDCCFGSTGRGGNLTGMRKLYWGKDAYVVRCCNHYFRVSEATFNHVKYSI